VGLVIRAKVMLGSSKYSRMAKRQCAPSLDLDRIDVVSTSDDDPSGTEGAVFLGDSSRVQRVGAVHKVTAPTL